MRFLDASDVMSLISGFPGCTPRARGQAKETQAALDGLHREEQAMARRRAEERAKEDARIQRNAMLMMRGSKQARELSREEREEVFRRSLKAMGLSEDGPMTPQQTELVRRMYRTMVLGEPSHAPSANTPPK